MDIQLRQAGIFEGRLRSGQRVRGLIGRSGDRLRAGERVLNMNHPLAAMEDDAVLQLGDIIHVLHDIGAGFRRGVHDDIILAVIEEAESQRPAKLKQAVHDAPAGKH